ncbi:MAG: purine-nucleoside phosphorylase [Bacteroidia bacterium]|nr:purine-nucleoside phosphorylase [Bacteroidia bacterium]
MSLHIGAKVGEIAHTVLITGDPLRAKYYAETTLTNTICYNQIRGMFGFTGKYKGKSISIQGTGIGIPSTALYIHELIHSYGVRCIIRVGTCGAIRQDIKLGQVILANSSRTDSNTIHLLNKDKTFQPKADSSLLTKAQKSAIELRIQTITGNVFSTDLFYSDDDPVRWNESIHQGVIGVDMETSVLYALGEKYNIQCLSILTVSDNILTGECASSVEREMKTFDMIELALEIAE